jgi:glycine/D-amino acid oxidase-like deaminating enzyme
VQPLAFARGLAAAAMSAGTRLHARSAARAVTRRPGGWRVATAAGHVDCARVLIATNASSGGLAPRVDRSQLAVRSFQIATRPLAPAERARILPGAPVVSDTRRVLRYFRLDRDGRVVVGGKGTFRAPRGPASFALQRRILATLYPDLADARIDFHWGGEVGVTLDRLPRLFVVDDGVLAALQDNGKGVAWCTASGAVLAEALTGAPLDSLPLPPARAPQPIPLHALRGLYKAAGSAWLRLRDGR